jgi:hypothetical protein
MATTPQITSIANPHGKAARADAFAITIKTITPKTITIR